MLRIYKYPIHLVDCQDVALPAENKILHIAFQKDQLCLWAIVNPVAHLTCSERIYVVGTGWQMPEGVELEYICTAQQEIFVWHFFREVPNGS